MLAGAIAAVGFALDATGSGFAGATNEQVTTIALLSAVVFIGLTFVREAERFFSARPRLSYTRPEPDWVWITTPDLTTKDGARRTPVQFVRIGIANQPRFRAGGDTAARGVHAKISLYREDCLLGSWEGRWFSTQETASPEAKRESDQITISGNGYPEFLDIGCVEIGKKEFRPWDNPEDASQRRSARARTFDGTDFLAVVRIGHEHGEEQWAFDIHIGEWHGSGDAEVVTVTKRRSVPRKLAGQR